MTITITLTEPLLFELKIMCYLRLEHLHKEHTKTLARRDSNQTALLSILREQLELTKNLDSLVQRAINHQFIN